MSSVTYLIEEKPSQPVLAICYDFDHTLSPMNMQEIFLQVIGLTPDDFWSQSNHLAQQHGMDRILSYMYAMKKESEGKELFTKAKLTQYGQNIRWYPGVEDWFPRINQYGQSYGLTIEHYIISSGLKEIIEGTSLGQKNVWKEIYASSYYYDDRNQAIWPAQVVNYTNKTQFLFRIAKGTLDVNDPNINAYFPPEKIRVPFRNMVYLGDSETDIPCMKLVHSRGGHAIGVYPEGMADLRQYRQLLLDQRIKYLAPANYEKDGPLDRLIYAIIRWIAANERLEQFHLISQTQQWGRELGQQPPYDS